MHWWLALALLSMASGCWKQIEHRADMPTKKDLAAIQKPLKVQKKWQTNAGVGVARNDVKLLTAYDNETLFTADATGKVNATAAKSGATLWSTDLNLPISAGPTVGEDKVVVATSNGKVVALDLQGNAVWISTTSSEILAAPLITNGMVLVHTMDGGLSAFSTVDGRQLWRYSHNLPPLMLRRSSTPIVANNKIIAGFANGKIMSMRKQDGAVEWSYDVARGKGRTDLQRMSDISADPVEQNGIIYAVGYQGNLVALRQDNGQILWERDLGSFSGFTVADNLLFLAGNTGNIYALDTKSGDTFWLQEDLEGRRLSRPAVMGNYVVIGDDDGVVHWFDKSSGARLARFSIDGKGVEATPVVHNDIVYLLGRSGKLVAVEVH